MKKIFEQDLQPVGNSIPEQPGMPEEDLDLEPLPGGESGEGEEIGDMDYQYTLTIKQEDPTAEGEDAAEPTFTFVLTPKEIEGEEPAEDELEKIENTSAEIEKSQAPQASVPTPQQAPLPESLFSDLQPILEQGTPQVAPDGGENTAPPQQAPAPEEPLPAEGEPELEVVAPELSEEDLKSFLESSEVEVKFSIDEETEFSIDEAVDYLKLYPESEIYVTVAGDIEEFKTKLDEFTEGKEQGLEDAATEDQNVMVDNEGQTLDMKNTPQPNTATPQISKESFSVFNFKNQKHMPDGIFLGHLVESKLYGRIDVKLTTNKLIIDKDVFELSKKINIAESKEKESIELTIKESEVERLLNLLKEKSDIIIKL